MHNDMSAEQAKARAVELLDLVDMPEPPNALTPHHRNCPGRATRQRAMIAQALLACDPKLLIADEPTTAFPRRHSVQAESSSDNVSLDIRATSSARVDAAILLITHDMGVVADLRDRIMVMKDGSRSAAETADSAGAVQRSATRRRRVRKRLLGAVPPSFPAVSGSVGIARQLEVTDVAGRFTPAAEIHPRGRADLLLSRPPHCGDAGRGQSTFRAVDNVSHGRRPGEVVGARPAKAGSGKSTLGKAAIGLVNPPRGPCISAARTSKLSQRGLREPRKKIGVARFSGSGLITESKVAHPGRRSLNRWRCTQRSPVVTTRQAKVDDFEKEKKKKKLDQVDLSRKLRNRYPHQLSGGQRQRVRIARALPWSGISDRRRTHLRAGRFRAGKGQQMLREILGRTRIRVPVHHHDLAVVEELSDRIAVMQAGRLVESGPAQTVLHQPVLGIHSPPDRSKVPVPDPGAGQARRREHQERLAQATFFLACRVCAQITCLRDLTIWTHVSANGTATAPHTAG